MAVVIGGQTWAIVQAQWRALSNHYFRASRGSWFWLTGLVLLAWYGVWAFAALGIAVIASDERHLDALRRGLPTGLFLMFGYWQIVPVLLVSSGLSLDLARLLPYPIPHARLFAIEVVLRLIKRNVIEFCDPAGDGAGIRLRIDQFPDEGPHVIKFMEY
jgi:hypothetical protein